VSATSTLAILPQRLRHPVHPAAVEAVPVVLAHRVDINQKET